jgi:hypothetical protein
VHNTCNSGSSRVVQSGGHTITKYARNEIVKEMGLDSSTTARDIGRAIERLKSNKGLPNGHHGKIFANGDYVDTDGKYVGNLIDYLF